MTTQHSKTIDLSKLASVTVETVIDLCVSKTDLAEISAYVRHALSSDPSSVFESCKECFIERDALAQIAAEEVVFVLGGEICQANEIAEGVRSRLNGNRHTRAIDRANEVLNRLHWAAQIAAA